MNGIAPELNYFCELPAQQLQALFSNGEVIDFLRETRAGVSLGILDLSDERADVVRCLNDAGVPVTAWLLLPKDQGYWFNLDNHPQAAARYAAFKDWTREHNLCWARIGLDIEPDINAMKELSTNGLAGLQRFARSLMNVPRLRSGTRAYHRLVQQIQADGYPVETYQIPFIVEERMANSSVIQRLAGLVDLPEANREVLMLYSSFVRPWGQGTLWSYAPYAQGIGIGSTGGGVDLTIDIPPLNWAELENDLLLARCHSDHLYIFSLEGCVKQNFLPQLRSMDWQQEVEPPYAAAQRVNAVRGAVRRGLWLSARPAWILFGMAVAVSGVTLIGRMTKRNRRG